ncbi:MAG TPA: CPBP family glutamic-type intramembrane protease [Solirubrobacterales bacterium]|nr:CPBP family glutamic-type intramembrane protease [Solirubrobacterales bacterium]
MHEEYAGFWRRALAATVDNLTWLVGGSMLLGLFPESIWEHQIEVIGVAALVLLSAWFNYFAFTEWRWGQTIGKNATGIEVRSLDGAERLTFGQASIRNLLRLVDFFLIGEVMVAASERKQRLGDKAARTVVVIRKRAGAGRAAPAPVRGGAGEPPPAAPGAAQPAPPPAAPEPALTGTPRPDRGFPLVPWPPSNTLWGLIGGLLVAIVVPPLLVLPFDPNIGDPDGGSEAGLLGSQAIFDAILVLTAIGVASSWRIRPLGAALRGLGMRRFELSAFGWMLLVLVIYYLGAAIFSTLVLEPEQEDIGKELGVCDPGLGIPLAAIALIVIAAPFTEELFFRGFFFGGLRSRWSLWPAAIVSGVLFGLVHAPTGPTAAIPLAGLGIGLAWLYEKTGSIWPSITAHLINNALAITVVLTSC